MQTTNHFHISFNFIKSTFHYNWHLFFILHTCILYLALRDCPINSGIKVVLILFYLAKRCKPTDPRPLILSSLDSLSFCVFPKVYEKYFTLCCLSRNKSEECYTGYHLISLVSCNFNFVINLVRIPTWTLFHSVDLCLLFKLNKNSAIKCSNY